MFRPQRGCPRLSSQISGAFRGQRRQLSLFRRNDKPKNAQRVRMFEAVTKRRIAYDLLRLGGTITFGYWLVVYQLGLKVEYGPEEETVGEKKEEDDDDDEESGEHDEEVVDFQPDEDALFIPLTLPRQRARSLYRGSDPEWQDFIKIASDDGRLTKIYEELGQTAFQAISQDPHCLRAMGKNGNLRKYWFDSSYPYGPPPDYARTGIEFGRGYIAISEETIPADEYSRMSRILWPIGTAQSVYQFWRTLWLIQWGKLKSAFGTSPTPDAGSIEYNLRKALEMAKAQERLRKGDSSSPPSRAPTGHDEGRTSQHPTSVSQAEGRKGPTQRPTVEADKSTDSAWMSTATTLGNTMKRPETRIANFVFINSMRKQAAVVEEEPPRGCFQILGMVNVAGEQAGLMFNVRAHYDPHESKIINLELGLMSVKPWRQTPRGGP